MCRSRWLVALLAPVALVVVAERKYPEFDGEKMAMGRTVWLENCETCHAYGIAGAPLVSDRETWEKRAAQGRESLYQHAIEGYFGPGGTMMPPRGGNDDLGSAEVKAAVEYMLRVASIDDND